MATPKLGKSRRPARLAGFETLEIRDQPAAGLLADLNTTGGSAFLPFPQYGGTAGAAVGQTLYFTAADGNHNPALFQSDGTAAGTKLVADVTAEIPDGAMSGPFYPVTQPVLAAGDKVFFSRYQPATGTEPWVSDGTAAGTKMITDLEPGNVSSFQSFVATVGSRAVFRAVTTAPSNSPTLYPFPAPALYGTDGTAAGTVALSPADSTPNYTVATGGKVYFTTDTYSMSGPPTSAIWVTDGTAAGTKSFATLPAGVRVATTGGYGVDDKWAAAADGKLYFTASSEAAGAELWVSDGTAAGTKQLADLNPTTTGPFYPGGLAYGIGSDPQQFTAVGGTIYFAADDGTHGLELWKTDGTAAGTVQVKDVSPTVGSGMYPNYGAPSGSVLSGLTGFDGKLYFAADDGTTGQQLYVSDGSAAGTVKLTSAVGNGVSSGFWFAQTPAVVGSAGGKVLFALSDAATGRQLWATDGTAAGTAMVKAIGAQQTAADRQWAGPVALGMAGGKLLFSADDGVNGRQLWSTDGSAAGTAMLARLNPNNEGSAPRSFLALGSKGLFVASEGPGLSAVYATDGTSAPVALARFAAAAVSDAALAPGTLVKSGAKAYFAAQNGAFGQELWATDGTAAGTKKLKSITPPAADTVSAITPYGVGNLTDVAGTLYFTVDLPGTGQEVWKTDGTEAGTTRVKSINTKSSVGSTSTTWPPPPSIGPVRQLTAVGDKLFFAANDGFVGEELWVSDGTEAGTKLVKDIRPAGDSYYGPVTGPTDLTALNGKLYFTAYDGVNGRQLWVSDGTTAGTKLAATVNSETTYDNQAPPSNPYPYLPVTARGMVAAGGKLFLNGYDADNGWQLWASDGTQAGTKRLTAMGQMPPYATGSIGDLTAVGSKVYFAASDTNGRQLWVSDGTQAGTKIVKQIGPSSGPDNPYPTGSQPQIVSVVGDKVLFVADDGVSGSELWVTDGTAAGTKLAKDFAAGKAGGLPGYSIYSPPPTAAVVGDRLLLGVTDAATGSEPWSVPLADLIGGTPTVPPAVVPPTVPPAIPPAVPPPIDPPTVPPAVPPPAATGSGPRVLAATFGGPKAGVFDRVTVKFSGAVNAATVGKATVAVTGPGGAVGVSAVQPVAGSNNTAFTLVLSKNLTAAGTYTAVVGPNVENAAGNKMDQNGNGVNGEAADTFTATATLGTPTSPPPVPIEWPPLPQPPSDVTGPRVVEATFGGPKAGVYDRVTIKFAGPVNAATVTKATVAVTGPNGSVRVSAVIPVAGSNGTAFTVVFSADQTAAGAYTATVGPGVENAAGNKMDQNGNGVNGEAADTFTATAALGTPTVPPAVPPAVPPSVPPAVPVVVTAGVVRVFDIAATEKVAWSGNLASVTLPAGPAYKVTVFWGDGRTAVGTLTRNTPTGATYTIAGTHTYADAGTYRAMIRVTGTGGKTVLSIDATATVERKKA